MKSPENSLLLAIFLHLPKSAAMAAAAAAAVKRRQEVEAAIEPCRPIWLIETDHFRHRVTSVRLEF